MTNRPSANAEFFATALIADVALRDAVLGDLAEEYDHVAQRSTRRDADRWYWWQLVRSAVPFSTMAVARGGLFGWLRLLVAIVVSYAALVVLVMSTSVWLMRVLPGGGGVTWQLSVASLATGVVCAALAGYVAAIIGGRSPIAPALALGAICMTLTAVILANGGDGSPLWYQIGLALIVMPSAIAGSVVRARQIVRRAQSSAPLMETSR